MKKGLTQLLGAMHAFAALARKRDPYSHAGGAVAHAHHATVACHRYYSSVVCDLIFVGISELDSIGIIHDA